MRISPWFLPKPHAELTGALLAFPPANKLTGQNLLHLSAIRRTVATAAHVLNKITSVELIVRQELQERTGAFVDPIIPLRTYPIELGMLGATAVPVVSSHELAVVDFTFNAWGEDDLPDRWDNRFGAWLAKDRDAECLYSLLSFSASDMVHDGSGTIVLSETSLLNPQRNPGWNKQSIQDELRRLLGAERFVWVPGRARQSVFFIDEKNAIVQLPQESDTEFESFLQIAGLIESATNAAGEHYTVHTMAPSVSKHSYLDATVANGHLLMPSYGEDSDAQAEEAFRQFLPQLRLVSMDTRALATRGLSWADVILPIPSP